MSIAERFVNSVRTKHALCWPHLGPALHMHLLSQYLKHAVPAGVLASPNLKTHVRLSASTNTDHRPLDINHLSISGRQSAQPAAVRLTRCIACFVCGESQSAVVVQIASRLRRAPRPESVLCHQNSSVSHPSSLSLHSSAASAAKR